MPRLEPAPRKPRPRKARLGSVCPHPKDRAASAKTPAKEPTRAQNAGPDNFSNGSLVRWYSNGWRFGRLVESKLKWSRVLHLNRIKRILTKELQPYERPTNRNQEDSY